LSRLVLDFSPITCASCIAGITEYVTMPGSQGLNLKWGALYLYLTCLSLSYFTFKMGS
jgi:hypothetical protein